MRIAKSHLTVCFLLLTAQPSFAQSSKAKQIDDYLKPFAEANQFFGVVLAAESGKVMYEKAFGLANADFKIPNQTNTRFGIASLTKDMTFVILARLIEAGKISLNDKLSKYIPDFPNGDKITVEMLVKHRAGIPHRVTRPDEEAVSVTSEEMVEKIKKAPLLFEPGKQDSYSSAGYTLLARTLEIASGKAYARLLEEYVFAPAQMKDSTDFDGESIIERRAQDYLLTWAGFVNAPLKDYSFLIGAGSVLSTARDVYKFGEAVLQGRYGETVKVSLIGKTAFSANGSTNGHRAYLKIDRDNKWGYVLVSNLNSGANDLILQNVEAILAGRQPAAPVVPNPRIIPNPNKNFADFVGRYDRQGGGGGFEVVIRNGGLLAGETKLYPTKPDCFFEYRFYGDVCFVRDDTGRVKEITWESPGIGKSVWVKQ